MKKALIVFSLLAAMTLPASAGLYRRVLHPLGSHVLLPVVKAASFPVRHPVKTEHGVKHTGAAVGHLAKKIAV